MQKTICDQCRRIIQSWQRRIIYANRAFCDAKCTDNFEEIQRQIYGCEQVPLPFDLLPPPPLFDP